MFRIVQVINNNCVIAKTFTQEQVVIMGKGVAFRKKRGDPIPQNRIQKVFSAKDPHILSDLTTLLANVPLDFVSVSYELIDQVKEKYSYALESYIYVTLTTHLFAAYQKLLQGRKLPDYLPDLSKNYPVVYQMADELMRGFAQKLQIAFPLPEQKSIAFHFMNAHVDEPDDFTHKKPKLEPGLINIIEAELKRSGIYRDQNTQIDYDRLLVHLKYLLVRLDQNQLYTQSFSPKMLSDLRHEYEKAWKITQRLGTKIHEDLNFVLPNDEQVYLTIHLERLLKEKKNDQNY